MIAERAAEWGRGLDELEVTLNAVPYLVFLVSWGFFLEGLRHEGRGRARFHLVLFLHLAPAPLLFVSSEHEFWQFLRWTALGGLALVIGVPHFFWDRGERARPRVVTTLLVALAFAGVLAWHLTRPAR